MFYLIIFLLLAFLAFYEIVFTPKNSNRLYFLVFLLLTFTSGFRYETGVDWVAYEYEIKNTISLYDAINNGHWDWLSYRLDIGYSILNALIKMFGGGTQTLFFIVAFLTQYLLYLNLKKYTNYVLLAYLIYYTFFFFIFDLSGIRQGLAMQIFLYAIKYIKEKNFWKYLWFIFLAASIHWTAGILIVLYFFVNRKPPLILVAVIVIFSTVVFTFQIKFLGAVMGNLLDQLNGYSLLEAKVKGYTTIENFSQKRSWNVYSVYIYLRLLIVLILSYKLRYKIAEKTPYFNIFFNLLVLQFLCIYTFYEFYEMSERFKFYFLISEVVLITFIIQSLEQRYKRQLASVFFIIFIFFNSYIYFLGLPPSIAYQPYQNYIIYKILDKKSDGYKRFKKHIQINDAK